MRSITARFAALLASLAMTVVGVTLATFMWQQRTYRHVVYFALTEGALVGPALYIVILAFRNFCRRKASRCRSPLSFVSGSDVGRVSSKKMAALCCRHVVIVVALGIFGVICVAVGMSYTSAWCCVRESTRQQLCDLALTTSRLFNRSRIEYHLAFGSLLGAARAEHPETGQDKSGMIPWEHDVDFAIYAKQSKEAIKLLRKNGFSVEKRKKGPLAFRIHLPGANHWAADWAMSWLDVYAYDVDPKTNEIICPNPKYKNKYKRPRMSDVKPFRSISFCGANDIPAPRLLSPYLGRIYGANFLVPNFPATNYRNDTCHLFKDC